MKYWNHHGATMEIMSICWGMPACPDSRPEQWSSLLEDPFFSILHGIHCKPVNLAGPNLYRVYYLTFPHIDTPNRYVKKNINDKTSCLVSTWFGFLFPLRWSHEKCSVPLRRKRCWESWCRSWHSFGRGHVSVFPCGWVGQDGIRWYTPPPPAEN